MRVIAIDIGGTKIASAVVTLDDAGSFSVEHVGKVPTCAMEGGPAVLERVIAQARARIQDAGDEEIAGVAISSAGAINPATGDVASANGKMPDWGGIRLGSEVTAATGLPCRVLNDVHAHALGEARRGAGMGFSSSIVVGIGTGVGGAFVEGGHIMLGTHMEAGHIGHVHCAEAAGMRCDCGATGHLECVASGTAITESYIRLGGDATFERDGETLPMDGAEINRRAVELGDEHAIAAQELAGHALGSVVAGVCSMLDPDCVILSGSVINCGHYWHDAVAAGFAETAMEPLRTTPILLASLGDNAPLVGAAEHFARSAYENI